MFWVNKAICLPYSARVPPLLPSIVQQMCFELALKSHQLLQI